MELVLSLFLSNKKSASKVYLKRKTYYAVKPIIDIMFLFAFRMYCNTKFGPFTYVDLNFKQELLYIV